MKNPGFVLAGMVFVLTLVWGWNGYQKDVVANQQPVQEMWAESGTPKWAESEALMNTLWAEGYRVVGYNVVLNRQGKLIKHIVMSLP